MTTLERDVFNQNFFIVASLSITPRLVVRDVKWGDEEIMTNPFGVPPPRTLATYIMPGRTHRTPAVMCANLQPSRRFLNLDRLILPGCLQQPLASGLAQMATYKDFSTTPAPSTAPRKSYVLRGPPQPLHALRPSQVTVLITHALTYPRLAFSIARLPV